LVVSVCLLLLGQDGELVEEELLFILRQTIEKLLRPLLGLLGGCLLGLKLLLLLLSLELLLLSRLELLLLSRLELLLLSRLRLLLLLLLWPEWLPCLLLRLELLLRVKLSLKLLLLLRTELLLLLLRIKPLLLLLRLESLVLRLEPLLRPRLIRSETSLVVGLGTEWLETLIPELALLEQSQLLAGSEDKSLLALQVPDQDPTLLS